MRAIGIVAALLIASAANAATYYVRTDGANSSSCGTADTAAGACLTVAGALARTSPAIACGDTIYVGSGSYSGFSITTINCSAANRLTVAPNPSAAPGSVVITSTINLGSTGVGGGARGGYALGAFRLNISTLPMVTLRCSGSGASETHDNLIDGLSVTSIPSDGGTGFLIGFNQADSCSNLGSSPILTAQNLNISNSANSNTRQYVVMFLGLSKFTLQDSTIADTSGRIFFGSSRQSLVFQRNTFKNALCRTYNPGPNEEGDACFQGYNNVMTFTNNVFDSVSTDNTATGASVVNTRRTSNSDTNTLDFRHNTLISGTPSTGGNSGYVANLGNATTGGPITIKDNIFIGYGRTGNTGGPIQFTNVCPPQTIDHNLYYNSATVDIVGGTCGANNQYGTGDVHNGVNPFSGCATPAACGYIPPNGSTACAAASDGTAIGAKNCAGGGGGDTSPPSSIANLSVLAPAKAPQLGAVLSWTAPSDNVAVQSYTLIGKGAGPCTTAACTEITAPTIADCSDGASLTAVVSSAGVFGTTLPAPKTAGQTESWTVKALRPNYKYAFAICSSDTSSNVSGRSNVVNITTAKYEGYGYQATGGGFTGSTAPTACAVTNLNDSGAGSFRACLLSNSFIGFALGGTVTLQSRLVGEGLSNYTVDGSTAPSPGITFTANTTAGINDMLRLGQGSHVIWTYIRGLGQKQWPSGAASNNDLLFTNNTTTAGQTLQHLVLDHLTLRNAGDSAFDLYDQTSDASMTRNLIVFNQHPQTTGGDTTSARISWWRNLWAQNGERQPQLVLAHTDMDIRNDVHYDWSYGNSGGSYAIRICNDPAQAVSANIVSNAFIAGSNTRAIHYGVTGACSTVETLPAGCSAQNNATGAASVCLSGSSMGQIWVQGNSFSAGSPTSSYSTVAAERSVPTIATPPTVAASALCTAVLNDVGTHFPLADETAAIAATFSAMGCSGAATCGNNVRETGEACDGTDLNSQTCALQGFPGGGTLACASNCVSFDTSGCIVQSTAGATLSKATCVGCGIQ